MSYEDLIVDAETFDQDEITRSIQLQNKNDDLVKRDLTVLCELQAKFDQYKKLSNKSFWLISETTKQIEKNVKKLLFQHLD